jgi:hypothetical protein
LVSVIDRLGINAFAGRGVVLDLQGQIAADALDEDAILDRDVRMAAVAEGLARRHLPAELEGWREALAAKLGFRAAIDIAQTAAVEGPLENRDVVHARADLKNEIQVGADQRKLAERRLRIDLIQPSEIGEKALVVQDAEVGFLERSCLRIALKRGENIAQLDLLF